MEYVRAIAMYKYAGGVQNVICVSAHMIATINQKNFLTSLRSNSLGQHTPGKSRADDQPVEHALNSDEGPYGGLPCINAL